MFHTMLVILVLLLGFSCQENPYPEEGVRTQVRVASMIRPPVYVIEPALDEMVFSEGLESKYAIDFPFR